MLKCSVGQDMGLKGLLPETSQALGACLFDFLLRL